MKRKRFIKLLMGKGVPRNTANLVAELVVRHNEQERAEKRRRAHGKEQP